MVAGIKLNIWYKVLSTVLGIRYVLNKYEFLSLGTTLITVKTFNSSLVPLGNSPNSFTCHLRPSFQPLPTFSLTVCHDNPSSKPLGPSPRADPSSQLGLAVYPLPFLLRQTPKSAGGLPDDCAHSVPLLSSLALMQETGALRTQPFGSPRIP